MTPETPTSKSLMIVQGKPIENALRRAVRHALLIHKRAGNTIASWEDGRVVMIPAEQIQIEQTAEELQPPE